MKKKLLLLGATGSIGSQTLDVLRQHPDEFELVGISAGHQIDKLKDIIDAHPEIQMAALASLPEGESHEYKNVPILVGEDAMTELVKALDYDLLVNAAVGFRGLKPTLTSLEKGKDVALANKESLVCGGDLVKEALKKTNTKLYPIDSEHSAIFQCLQGNNPKEVERLIITASGGSFRNKTRDELKDVTKEQALAHPNWNMGARITLDSASMVNKGFEVMEAHHLFDLPYDKIDTVLHDESIIHSMVEYQDHAIMAQLGSADMRLPIQYALMYPRREVLEEDKPLDMTKTLNLHFKEMDFERFPMLKLAYEVGKAGGNKPAVFNGADEEAIALFLEDKISFLDIETSIEKALEAVEFIENPDYQDLEASDKKARKFVRELWEN